MREKDDEFVCNLDRLLNYLRYDPPYVTFSNDYY